MSIMSMLKNSISISLTKIITSVSLFLVAVIVARWLGPEEFGKYSIALSLFAIFELVSNVGLENLAIREIARDESTSGLFLSQGAVLGVLSTGACFLMLILTANIMSYPGDIKKVIYLTGIVLLPAFLNFLCETICIALRQASFVLYASLVRETCLLTASIVFLLRGHGIFAVIMALVISRVVGVCCFLYYLLGSMKVTVVRRIDVIFLKRIFTMMPVFFFISVSSAVFFEIDTLILSKIVAVSDVGIYSIAKKLVRANFLIILGVGTAMFPRISQAYASSKAQFMRWYKVFFAGIFLSSVLIVLITLLVAPVVIRLFLGSRFISALPVLEILIWATIPWSIAFLLSRFLIAAGRQNKDLWALCIGLVSMAVGGIFLSLKWAHYGMAFANLISLTILAGVSYFFTRTYVIAPLRNADHAH